MLASRIQTKEKDPKSTDPEYKPKISKLSPMMSSTLHGSVIASSALSNGLLVTLEQPRTRLLAGYKPTPHFYQHAAEKKSIVAKKDIVSISPVPEKNQIITCQHKPNSSELTVNLWDFDLQKCVDGLTATIQPEFEIYPKFFSQQEIYCTKNYFLVIYALIHHELGPEKFIELRDLSTFKQLDRYKIADNFLMHSCFFSNRDPSLFFMINDYELEIWKIIGNKLVKAHSTTLDDDNFLSLALLPDGKTLISGHDKGNLRFWTVKESEHDKSVSIELLCSTTYKGSFEADDIMQMQVLPDAKHLVSWNQNTVTLWDISNMQEPQILNRIPGLENFKLGLENFKLGLEKAVMTDDWRIITSNDYSIEFPILFKKYKEEIEKKLLDCRLSRDTKNVVMSYLFSPPKPIINLSLKLSATAPTKRRN